MKKLGLFSCLLVLAFALVACTSKPNSAQKSGNNPQVTTAVTSADGSTAATDDTAATAASVSTSTTSADETAALAEIKAKGKLVLATSADYPPYEWHLLKDGKDEIVGFDVEIARSLAQSIGVELEIKDLDFEAIVPSVSSGQADIGIAGLSVTKERLEAVNMTKPYFQNKQLVLVPKTEVDKYKSVADFQGKTVGAQTGSIQESTVREQFPKDVQIKSLAKLNNLVMEVLNGTADALVIAKSSAEQYAKQFPKLAAIDVNLPDEPGVCIALKKGNDALTSYLNKELQKLIDTGKIKAWISQYEKLSAEAAATK